MGSAMRPRQLCMSSQPSQRPSSKPRTKIKMKSRGVGCRSLFPRQPEFGMLLRRVRIGASFHCTFPIAIIAIKAGPPTVRRPYAADGGARGDAGKRKEKGGSPMVRQLALASFLLLTPSLASAQTAKFQIEEATIEDIQAAILRGELTSTGVVQLYLSRIKMYNGTCVNQPDGVLGAGPITPIKNAHQLNALMTLNLRPARREKLGFDARKAR